MLFLSPFSVCGVGVGEYELYDFRQEQTIEINRRIRYVFSMTGHHDRPHVTGSITQKNPKTQGFSEVLWYLVCSQIFSRYFSQGSVFL